MKEKAKNYIFILSTEYLKSTNNFLFVRHSTLEVRAAIYILKGFGK